MLFRATKPKCFTNLEMQERQLGSYCLRERTYERGRARRGTRVDEKQSLPHLACSFSPHEEIIFRYHHTQSVTLVSRGLAHNWTGISAGLSYHSQITCRLTKEDIVKHFINVGFFGMLIETTRFFYLYVSLNTYSKLSLL